tara:strand:+ start:5897 stop:6316 length:420 start_codon:yes stop_codon:yes gene_type:complete
MNQTSFQNKFVDQIPEELEEGILYISLPFSTSIHLCACGCGQEVVTPLSVNDWVIVLDGENVSLYPSIGNWSFPCRSHYWIRHGRVISAESWTEAQISRNRMEGDSFSDRTVSDGEKIEHHKPLTLWTYIRRFIFRQKR